MPSRTTSSLTCHVITSVFSLITFTRQKRGLASHCSFVFSHKVALLTEEDEDILLKLGARQLKMGEV